MANSYKIYNSSSGLFTILSNGNTLVLPKSAVISVSNLGSDGVTINYTTNSGFDFTFDIDDYANVVTPVIASQAALKSNIEEIINSQYPPKFSAAITTITVDTTIDNTYSTVLVDASGGVVTVTLPDANGNEGLILTIKKIDSSSNNVVLDGQADDLIDGELTKIISSQYDSLSLQSDNTNWYII